MNGTGANRGVGLLSSTFLCWQSSARGS